MNFSYIDVAIKLALGLLSLIVVINYTGKGNLAPTSASDQVQNYVLGGIIGGVIYNPSITILQYCIILLIWFVGPGFSFSSPLITLVVSILLTIFQRFVENLTD